MSFHHQVTREGESRPAWHITEVGAEGIERYETWCLSPREFSGTRDQPQKRQKFSETPEGFLSPIYHGHKEGMDES